jgi:hypothetical protein
MSNNTIGTIFRIFGIFFTLLIFWYTISNIPYFLASLIFNIVFSFKISLLFFGIVLTVRIFYPKNIFTN